MRLSRTSAAKGLNGPVRALGALDDRTGQPAGIIHRHRRGHVVADGKDVNDVRVFEMMNRNPAVMDAATAIR